MYVFRMAPGKTLPETAKAVPIRPKVYIYIILQLPVPGVKWKPGSGKRETVISHRGGGRRSMVEQSHAGERHDHAVAVGGFDDLIVPDGAARLGNVGNAALVRSLNVVPEREECV